MTLNDMPLIQGLPPKWSLIDLHHCFYIVYLLTAKNIAVSNYTISSLLQYINFLINFDEKTFECLLVQICYRPSERSVFDKHWSSSISCGHIDQSAGEDHH